MDEISCTDGTEKEIYDPSEEEFCNACKRAFLSHIAKVSKLYSDKDKKISLQRLNRILDGLKR